MNKNIELKKIANEIESCKACKRNKIGKAVPGEGNPNAKVVFIGEAPGKKEAETGRPFIGSSGTLLRKLIFEIGLNEKEIYITSPVKYLPKYRTPTLQDIAHGRQHLQKQLEIIKPKIIVLMGNTACIAVLGKKCPVSKHHGSIVSTHNATHLITYHPAAPKHNYSTFRYLRDDFQKLKSMINK